MKTVTGLIIILHIFILIQAEHASGAVFGGEDMERAAIVLPGEGGPSLAEARTLLSRYGIKGMLCYPPSVIAGYFPEGFDPGIVPGAAMALSASGLESLGVDRMTGNIVASFLQGDFETSTPHAGDQDPDGALLRRQKPFAIATEEALLGSEIPREIRDAVASTIPPGVRKGTPREITARNIDQNSEFLIGSVLVNIIFPEGIYGQESWTDDEIEAAIRDISGGFSRIQQIAHWVDLTITTHHSGFHRIPVTNDLIETNAFDGTEGYAIYEAMAAIGYDAGPGGALLAVHNFNNDTREEFGTDWVFTVFVADQSAHYDPTPIMPDAGCWGGAGYVLNSFQGGPYMAIPYPACRYGYGGPFSNLFAIGMFRIFWGQYESDSSAAHCEPEHGYLSVPNFNSIHVYLGQTEPCGFGYDCIMHTFAFDTYFPVCEYTMGQIGLGDDNSNSVPDVYEVYPELEAVYVPGFNSDTTYDGSYFVSAKATNGAVPNMNPAQYPLTRIDYAPTLEKGWVQINSDLEVDVPPSDGVWDESSEPLSYVLLEGLEPGLNFLKLKVENNVGLRDEILMEVTYIGMKFFDTGIDPRPEGMVLDWKTSDLIFGADFELMRRDLSAGGPKEMIAVIDGEDYDEAGANRRVYRYIDEAIEQGHLYGYSVVSRFEAMKDGVLEEFVDESTEMVGRALIPVAGRMVSSILPNPMGPGCDEIVFTMDIPRSWWSPSGTRAGSGKGIYYAPSDIEIKTDVKVSVFDVRGKLVLDIFELPVYGGLITRTWNGRDRRGSRVSPGVYFLRVTANSRQEVRKVIVLR